MATALVAAPVHARIPELAWESTEVVDSPVDDVSTSSGASVLFANGLWHVVYVKSGDIYHRARSDSGWLAVTRLSDDPAPSRGPNLALGGGFLQVIWEDERTGHPEVWARRWNGGPLWSPEECLTCDGVPSRAPVVAGDAHRSLAVWEECSLSGAQVWGSFFKSAPWEEPRQISNSPAEALEPSVSAHFNVVWTDTRDGDREIYETTFGPWSAPGPGRRLTDLPGPACCPSIHAGLCCETGDLISPYWFVAFEFDSLGIVETSAVDSDDKSFALSSRDAIPSARPNVGGFTVIIPSPFPHGFPSYSPRTLVTWTDSLAPGGAIHVLASSGSRDTFSTRGLGASVVGAVWKETDAEIMVLWAEEMNGVPTLVSRSGRLQVTVGVEDPRLSGTGIRFSVVPNPCRDAAAFRFDVSYSSEVEIRIADVAGRLVRNLDLGRLGPGTQIVRWDIRDTRGRRVEPGRYHVVAKIGETRLLRSFVVLE